MQELSGLRGSARRIYVYTSYIHNRLLRGFIAVSLILSALHSMIVVTGLPSIVTTQGGALFSLFAMTSLIYYMSIVYIAYSLAQELGEGPATLYLSHPLGRGEYMVSWLIAGLVTTTVLYATSILAPLLVMDIELLSTTHWEEALLPVLEGVLTGGVSFLTAVLTRRRGMTFFSGLIYLLLLPFALMIIRAITWSTPPGGSKDAVSVFIELTFAVLYPSKYYLMKRTTDFGHIAFTSFLLSCGFLLASIAYAKYKMEV